MNLNCFKYKSKKLLYYILYFIYNIVDFKKTYLMLIK